jgi:acyl-CoA synthetase (AMP-forming)/AMP-acid ligase II
LERIICGGEVLSDALRGRVEAFFRAGVFDSYGMTETFPLAGLVCSQRHLHFAADQGLVEVLDPASFAPTAPGGVGTLVVTPFLPYRETTLLLRLATGDLVRRLEEQPTCELAGQPATSPLLGKADLSPGLGTLPLYQRDVLELLDAEADLPQPVRYGVEPAADGFELHVLGPPDDPALVARLEERAAAAALPISKIVPHRDLAEIARPQFVRALLHETVVVRAEEAGAWTLR